jgi:hypothetical protein
MPARRTPLVIRVTLANATTADKEDLPPVKHERRDP